jgi:hypothetical protein
MIGIGVDKMKTKESDIPIKSKKHSALERHNLEDYEGATREEVFRVLTKVATSPRPSQKHVQPLDSSSK